MKILILSDCEIDPNDLILFLPLAEPKEIVVFRKEQEIMTFLEKNLINEQRHIDLIVINRQRIDRLLFEEDVLTDRLIDWIRESDLEYSDNNFNFKSIPVVIFDENLFEQNNFVDSFKNTKYDKIMHPYDFCNGPHFIEKIGSPIYNWVQNIGSELDNLNLDLSFNFSMSRINQVDTLDYEILSESFLRKRRSLDYLWIGDKLEIIDHNVDGLSQMIRQSLNNKSLRNEKEYHKYFLNNPLLLKGEDYKEIHYERQLYYKQSRSYVEPDFINIPRIHSFNKPEIFEVKLPNQRLINEKTAARSRSLKKGVAQVTKYRNYLNDFDNHDQLVKRLGLDEKKDFKFDNTLLIGTEIDKEENVSSAKEYGDCLDIAILTYQDLLNRYSRLYQRIKKYRLN